MVCLPSRHLCRPIWNVWLRSVPLALFQKTPCARTEFWSRDIHTQHHLVPGSSNGLSLLLSPPLKKETESSRPLPNSSPPPGSRVTALLRCLPNFPRSGSEPSLAAKSLAAACVLCPHGSRRRIGPLARCIGSAPVHDPGSHGGLGEPAGLPRSPLANMGPAAPPRLAR
ncbi:hypothetical protein VPH35_029812 [Triticum aestivum]